MSFGSENVLGAFRRTMNVILSYVKLQYALAYLDHVDITSKTPSKDIDHVRSVLTLVQDARILLKPKTCELFMRSIH